MKQIQLTNSEKKVLVSDGDYAELVKYRWWLFKAKTTDYAARSSLIRIEGVSHEIVLMHRWILNAESNQDVDHRNHNGLDNQRENIRLCSQSQNMMNARKRAGVSSRFKGVSFYSSRSKWEAYINKDYKRKKLGYFKSEIDAAKAYNDAARETFGEFAFLNEV